MCLQALCSLKDFPPFLLRALLANSAPDERVAPPLREHFALPAVLRQALVRGHNASQQAAIAAALTRRQEGITLIQACHPPSDLTWALASGRGNAMSCITPLLHCPHVQCIRLMPTSLMLMLQKLCEKVAGQGCTA